jgi:hypothetical protein
LIRRNGTDFLDFSFNIIYDYKSEYEKENELTEKNIKENDVNEEGEVDEEEEDEYDLTPICEELIEQFKDYNGDEDIFEIQDYEKYLFWNWGNSLILTENEIDCDYEYFLYYTEIAELYDKIALSFENMIENQLKKLVEQNLNNQVTYKQIERFNKIKMYLTTVISISDYTSTNFSNTTIIDFFEKFDDVRNLKQRQEDVLRTFDIFLGIQNEVLYVENQIIQKEQEKRDKRLNDTLFYLTGLTVISVLADIISTTDYANNTIPYKSLRLLIIIFIPAVVIIFINESTSKSIFFLNPLEIWP